MNPQQDLLQRIEHLNDIGIALSEEMHINHLLDKILGGAQSLTSADGGTLYLIEDNQLHFKIMRTRSLGVAHGCVECETISLEPIALYDDQGQAKSKTVAAYAAIHGKTVNIANIYETDDFDFSGTRAYDKKIGYHSQSFLTVPMRNHERDIIGVLQLINAQSAEGEVVPFSIESQKLAESLASQAAIALTNQHLIQDLHHLLEKFIEVIAEAIDEKSPFTGEHCRRVPKIAMLLAEAINETRAGPYAEFVLNEKELYELKIAALMHDCGKITTPVHVVEKSTKLETIFDRIHLVESRIEIMRRDLEIAYLKERLAQATDEGDDEVLPDQYQQQLRQLDEDLAFLHQCNHGSEFMSEAEQARVEAIARREWQVSSGELRQLLNDEEVYNLNIAKGTLTAEEREVINNHIVLTLRMLERLPFPKHLKDVPEIAGCHHERMDGKGYPRGLMREQMSLPARLMGIADIFEALTAADRPYKKPMPLSQALTILGRMKLEGHIDPDIFDVFMREKVYLRYAEAYLEPEQIDEIDLGSLPGFSG